MRMRLSPLARLARSRTSAAFALAAAAAVIGGCYSEGGTWWSEDQQVYISRPHQPWNITLKDTRTGQDVWTVEVPVGKQLVVHFVKGAGTTDSYTPDLMEWAIMDDGAEFERLDNTLPVPPANARRIDTALRTGPELPPRMVIATTPSSGEPKSNDASR